MILIKESDTQYLDPDNNHVFAIKSGQDINEFLNELGINEQPEILTIQEYDERVFKLKVDAEADKIRTENKRFNDAVNVEVKRRLAKESK